MCQCMRKNSMDFGTKSTSQNGLLTTESRVQYINKTYLKYVCLILIDQFLLCIEVFEESLSTGKIYLTVQLNPCPGEKNRIQYKELL